MKTDLEYAKEEAIRQFARRKDYAKHITKVENQSLHAGSPMYYYCEACGMPTEVLPENYLFRPYQFCSQCQGLKDEGWLKAAQDACR